MWLWTMQDIWVIRIIEPYIYVRSIKSLLTKWLRRGGAFRERTYINEIIKATPDHNIYVIVLENRD